MFDGKEKVNREQPPMPTTDGVEYPRAASWAAGNCANVLNDDKGKIIEDKSVLVVFELSKIVIVAASDISFQGLVHPSS